MLLSRSGTLMYCSSVTSSCYNFVAVNSNNILSVGGASLVCEYLSTGDNKVVFLAVEVLWNLLEEGSQIQVHLCVCWNILIIFYI